MRSNYQPGVAPRQPALTSPDTDEIDWQMREQTWREDALCSQTDPELWFPVRGEQPHLAKAICGACPVRTDCLSEALRLDERLGVWGGLQERARRPLQQAVNRGADPTDVAVAAIYGQEVLRRWSA